MTDLEVQELLAAHQAAETAKEKLQVMTQGLSEIDYLAYLAVTGHGPMMKIVVRHLRNDPDRAMALQAAIEHLQSFSK